MNFGLNFVTTSQPVALLRTEESDFIFNVGEPLIDGNFLVFVFVTVIDNVAFEI